MAWAAAASTGSAVAGVGVVAAPVSLTLKLSALNASGVAAVAGGGCDDAAAT